MSNRRYVKNSQSAFPRKTLTIVFGAIPATMFCWWALIAIVAGVSQILSVGGALLVLFGSAGLYGTFSLWLVAFGRETKCVIVGLLVGSVAMVPLLLVPSSIIPSSDLWNGRFLTTVLEASPVIVAVAWLIYFFLDSSFRSQSQERRQNG